MSTLPQYSATIPRVICVVARCCYSLGANLTARGVYSLNTAEAAAAPAPTPEAEAAEAGAAEAEAAAAAPSLIRRASLRARLLVPRWDGAAPKAGAGAASAAAALPLQFQTARQRASTTRKAREANVQGVLRLHPTLRTQTCQRGDLNACRSCKTRLKRAPYDYCGGWNCANQPYEISYGEPEPEPELAAPRRSFGLVVAEGVPPMARRARP